MLYAILRLDYNNCSFRQEIFKTDLYFRRSIEHRQLQNILQSILRWTKCTLAELVIRTRRVAFVYMYVIEN